MTNIRRADINIYRQPEENPFSAYVKSSLYPCPLPFRMVIVGSSGSGKTTLISTILSGRDRETRVEYDFYGGYGLNVDDNIRNEPWPDGIGQIPFPIIYSKADGTFPHTILVYDDPDLTQINVRNFLNNIFKKVRHLGCSIILCMHSLEDINRRGMMGVMDNMNIIVFTKQGASSAQGQETLLTNKVGSRQMARDLLGVANDPTAWYSWGNLVDKQVTYLNSE